MLEPALLNETSEILSKNFSADEIDKIGNMLYSGYSTHEIAGESNHITFSSSRAASVLVSYSNTMRKTFELVKLLIELDDSTINGKAVGINGLETYLNKLTKCGIIYDFKKENCITATRTGMFL